MSYIPKRTPHGTVFPLVNGVDFYTAVGFIKEKWIRLYPHILYEPIASAPGIVTYKPVEASAVPHTRPQYPDNIPPYTNDVSAVPNQTVVDDLYGESLPQTISTDPLDPTKTVGDVGAWKQPQGDHQNNSANTPVFVGSFWINAHVKMMPWDMSLSRKAIDEVRELYVAIPTVILDEAVDVTATITGIRCQIGDRFTWSNSQYEVCEVRRAGYWKKCDIYLYCILGCQLWRWGS